MINSTLCYIEKNGCFLMLFRNKKINYPCEGKWVGIGGKFEPGEDADQCLLREVWEETGLKLTDYHFHGIVHFVSNELEDEDMYLYSSDDFEPEDTEAAKIFHETGDCPLPVCSEGMLSWVPEEEVLGLPMWEGDRAFVSKLMSGAGHISMRLQYTGEHCKITEE